MRRQSSEQADDGSEEEPSVWAWWQQVGEEIRCIQWVSHTHESHATETRGRWDRQGKQEESEQVKIPGHQDGFYCLHVTACKNSQARAEFLNLKQKNPK